jgi:hypothetical protein
MEIPFSQWRNVMAGAAEPQTSGQVTSGWLMFAGLMLCVIGFLNVIDGLAALSKKQYFLVTDDKILIFNFTAWGVIWLIVGIVQLVVGGCIMARQTWARMAGVVFIVIAIIGQVAFLSAYPLWSVISIIMCIVALYALIVPPSQRVAL